MIVFQKVDYITYLTTFNHLYDIPKERKNSEYRKYLELLLDYLHGYLLRIKPLFDVEAEMEGVVKEFNAQWENGTFPGWPVMYLNTIQTKFSKKGVFCFLSEITFLLFISPFE